MLRSQHTPTFQTSLPRCGAKVTNYHSYCQVPRARVTLNARVASTGNSCSYDVEPTLMHIRSGSGSHLSLPPGYAVGNHYQQQQQQPEYYAAAAVDPWPTAAAGSSSPQQQLPVSTTPQTPAAAATADEPAAPTVPAPAVGLPTGIAALGERRLLHVHVPFAALFCYLGLMAAAARSSDWYLDVACFGAVWAGLWAACCRLRPSPRTAVLVNLLPLLHLSGALGTYHWELGNLSWDILVHISNGFIGTLLFAAVLTDVTAVRPPGNTTTINSSSSSSKSREDASALEVSDENGAGVTPTKHRYTGKLLDHKPTQPAQLMQIIWRFMQLSVLLIVGTSCIELVEGLGGQVAGVGEGMFLRGAGDFCTASVPCSEEVDTAKDMVDNVAGMMMAMIALAAAPAKHRGLSLNQDTGNLY